MPKQEKKKIPTIALWGGVSVAGLLLLVGVVFGIMFASAVNNPSRSFMGSYIIRVNSDIMAPEIESGDVIYLDDDISKILTGDIIAFIYDEYGTIAVHRVHNIVTNDDGEIRYITKGDNNEYQDTNPVHPGNVIGVYKHKAGFIGKILGSFQRSASINAVDITTIDWETPLEGNGSESSPYLIKSTYDFQKYIECFDSDSPYGTITSDFEIYASPLNYGNNESNAKFFEEQVEKGYLRFQNGDIKVTHQGVEVVCENRINLSDLSQTDAPSNDNTVETTSPTVPEVNIAESIVGIWECWNGEIWRWEFNTDGTYDYSYSHYYLADDGKSWIITEMGSHHGNYVLSGDKLTITPTTYEGEAFPEFINTLYIIDKIEENTLSLQYMDSGKIVDFAKAN